MQIFYHSNVRTLCGASTINRQWKTTPSQTTPSSNSLIKPIVKLIKQHHFQTRNLQVRAITVLPKLRERLKPRNSTKSQHKTSLEPRSGQGEPSQCCITLVSLGDSAPRDTSSVHLTSHTQGRWAKPTSRMSHLNLEGNEKKKLLACFLQALSPRSRTRT